MITHDSVQVNWKNMACKFTSNINQIYHNTMNNTKSSS